MITSLNKSARPLALLLASALALSATAAPSGSVSVKADADSAVMVMGDRNRIHLDIDIPEAYASTAQLVDFPILSPGVDYIEYKGIDVVASDSSSTFADGRRKISLDFTVQAFDPGTVSLPPFAVVPAPGADTAFSNVVTFKVLPVDVDSLETIHPMASIVNPASRWYDYIPNWIFWTLLAIAIVAIGVVLYFVLRKRKEIIELRKTPVIPPYDLAISRLNELRMRKLPEGGHEKEYYTELVDILRQYLQGRFGINAMEMTSTQIVKALRSNPATKMTADEVRAVLSIADFVKFAKVRPLPDDNIKAFTRAQDFVEQTRPKPEPEEGASEKPVQPANNTNRQ